MELYKTKFIHEKVVGNTLGISHSNSTNTNFPRARWIQDAKRSEGFGE